MASLKVAVDFVLRQEDSTLSGEITTLKGDNGGATRFGLASTDHPELVPEGYFDESRVSRDQALAIAEQVYGTQYGGPLHVVAIVDQAVATAVLSMGINSGTARAAKVLQTACSALGRALEADGDIGPKTLGVVNALNADQLLASFSTQADGFYRDLAEQDANDLPFLQGWENRVAAWTKNAASLRAQAQA